MRLPIVTALLFTLVARDLGHPATARAAALFAFPTSNQAILESNGEEKFFVGTPGKPWTSGSYGCVRSSGFQFHEGADIRALERDRRNEPIDPVLNTADGWIVHVSRQAWKSNYGKYVVVGHKIEGLEVFSLYAHLSAIGDEWEPGKWIAQGQQIGIMGRTSNTKQRISRDRAHLHFEIALLVNHEFPAYFKRKYPKGINDHGMWNGQNLVGMDPAEVFRLQATQGADFTLRDYLRERTAMFKVQVGKTDFPWLDRYLPLVLKNSPPLSPDQIHGYEIAYDYSGLPYQLRALTEAEAPEDEIRLTEVDQAIYEANRCRKLLVKTGAKWRLTARGKQAVELLLFNPEN